ncbi:helix-turn-helix domain-containing protein [Fibrella aquatilis]|uniref:AraC family transcriptional regulator n=1 Tax=Fibrella aquatilis TaxID=2817059 RepID=A0A939G6A4_9BACT|nr:AraC family transcriptional regulator [Fibrella aquatilis]MBO0931993.1 AraC family transcriptional regulator [Fibrella aquatilis]
MSNKHIDTVNHDKFVAQYTDAISESYNFKSSAIQIYPLSIASSFIKLPSPLFRTNYNFLLLFLSGGGRQQVDSEIIDLNANDVLFIREGHLNSIIAIDQNTTGYFIHVDSTLLPQIITDGTLIDRLTFYPKHTIAVPEMEWICTCCDLIAAQQTDAIHTNQIQSALLKAIFLKLAEASATTICQPDRQADITLQFKRLLYDNFIINREVKFYADALAISENYLNKCVNYCTNKPPKQHINEMVIGHSKILLQDWSRDISQVAFDLNFSNPSYFGRLFKQLTKQTPTAYRDALRQELSEQSQGF